MKEIISSLDIGSSTGGFTDCALKNAAQKVIAVDVGTDQFDLSLRFRGSKNQRLIKLEYGTGKILSIE